jgi:putative ABC transport system ATP-binding protein
VFGRIAPGHTQSHENRAGVGVPVREENVSDEPVLRLERVARDFYDGMQMRRVLEPTDLDIAPGEFTIIAGPSGSGKTTLLTIMGLILQPSEGRIFVRGGEVTGAGEDELATLRLRNYGFVFQTPTLLAALTVMENVLITTTIQGGRATGALRRRAGELLERFGLGRFADLKAGQLSGGQKQRIAVVRALINDPAVLLCDEPTSSLDVNSSGKVLDTIKQLSREKDRGVALVTHDPRVFPYADRLIKLEEGRITYDTTSAEDIEEMR